MKRQVFRVETDGFNGAWYPCAAPSKRGIIAMLGAAPSKRGIIAMLGGSERDIRHTCPGAVVKSGLPITGSSAANAKSAVQRWLSANGLL